MTIRGPERKKRIRNLSYAGTALVFLAIDGFAIYGNVKGFTDGKFMQIPLIPIILDSVILVGNVGVIWGFTHPYSPIRTRRGGCDEPPRVMGDRSRGPWGKDGTPHRDILN